MAARAGQAEVLDVFSMVKPQAEALSGKDDGARAAVARKRTGRSQRFGNRDSARQWSETVHERRRGSRRRRRGGARLGTHGREQRGDESERAGESGGGAGARASSDVWNARALAPPTTEKSRVASTR